MTRHNLRRMLTELLENILFNPMAAVTFANVVLLPRDAWLPVTDSTHADVAAALVAKVWEPQDSTTVWSILDAIQQSHPDFREMIDAERVEIRRQAEVNERAKALLRQAFSNDHTTLVGWLHDHFWFEMPAVEHIDQALDHVVENAGTVDRLPTLHQLVERIGEVFSHLAGAAREVLELLGLTPSQPTGAPSQPKQGTLDLADFVRS